MTGKVVYMCLLYHLPSDCLTHLNPSAPQTRKMDFVNSVDPEGTAHNEPSHQELRCLLFPFCHFTVRYLVSIFV